MASVLVLNGPNLNTLGTRKPEVYGSTTLADVEEMCRPEAGKLGLDVVFRQSNYEGQLIDWIHETGAAVKAGESIGVVYNPGAHTHYSYAIRDAIEAREPAGDRAAHLERARPRGVPAPLGDLAGRPRHHRRLRRAGLLAGHPRPVRTARGRGAPRT